ncbi:MAG: hypothetical protein A3B68_08820 [Candidatus Melainabacteria bacterium RIFCSPHIGHO2_02_FULL_34_12]|nr:MAG: hypothetical protein A3B68_08820 [Candidatus Melainabacteria bacterium RIFCSPHIGHO2_02_FULL_34_12]
MGHGLIKLMDGTSSSDASHAKALKAKEAKQNRFELLHGGVNVSEPVQNLVSLLNGFNGQIDTDRILWQTRPAGQTTITYRGVDVALLLIPQGIHNLSGIKITSLRDSEARLIRPDVLADKIKRNPDVQQKMKTGNLNGAISVLRFNSKDDWALYTRDGSTHIRLNQKPLYLVSPEFEIRTVKGNELVADLNEGTNGNAENADVYRVADKILEHFISN